MNHCCQWPLLIGLAAMVPGCSFAPAYMRPSVETPAAFKESADATDIWKVAQPDDAAARSNWWSVFHDAELNALEE